jgi:transmembrane sensor
MKLNINIPEHAERIAKYLAGEMDSNELANFLSVVASHPDNDLLVNEMQAQWAAFPTHGYRKPNVDKAWLKISTLIGKEEAKQATIGKTAYLNWVKWAAAVVVIGLVTASLVINSLTGREVIIKSLSDSSTLVHSLSDGSNVYLMANSELSYRTTFGKRNRKVSLKGEAFFDVAKNPVIPFEIETTDAVVRVLGTSFTLKANVNAPFELIVSTGAVSILSKHDAKQTVTALAGEVVTIANKQLAKSNVADKNIHNSMKQRLQFKDESVANIIRVINKTYNISIILDASNVESRLLTVTFHNNSIESIVDVLCATLNLKATYINETIILSELNSGEN